MMMRGNEEIENLGCSCPCCVSFEYPVREEQSVKMIYILPFCYGFFVGQINSKATLQ